MIASIEAFISRHRMKPSRFGAEATGEPQLLASLKHAGRSPSLRVLERIAAYMARKDAEAGLAADHAASDSDASAGTSSGKAGDVTAQVAA